MRNAVKEYIDLTSDQKKALWESATFVFDTNVFLNLYRYSKKTRTVLLEAMHNLDERVWMPHQVAIEFMRRRPGVIFESSERYHTMTNKFCAEFFKQCKEILRLSENDVAFVQLKQYISDWLKEHQTENVLVTSCSDDSILSEILDIYDARTGAPFDPKELENIKNEGKRRYEAQIPPGYKDAKKAKDGFDNNAFGDLIVWKQILKYAKEQSKSIIFVTHDQKDDWWETPRGKTIGPRYELRKEFLDCVGTDMMFHMYTMDGFITQIVAGQDRSVIDEVKSYNEEPNQSAAINAGRSAIQKFLDQYGQLTIPQLQAQTLEQARNIVRQRQIANELASYKKLSSSMGSSEMLRKREEELNYELLLLEQRYAELTKGNIPTASDIE